MAFFDDPDQIVRFLQDTWRKYDTGGIANAVIPEAHPVDRQGDASPSPFIRRAFNDKTRVTIKPAAANGVGSMIKALCAYRASCHGATGEVLASAEFGTTYDTYDLDFNNAGVIPAEDAAKDQKPAAELDKVVRWKPPPPGAAPQQVFVARTPPARPTAKTSGLSRLLRENPAAENMYSEYAQWSGEGHKGVMPTVTCCIVLPPAQPGEPRRELSVCVLRDGDIQKLIGVALWMYKEQRMAPPALDAGVDNYELRDVDDGEPDMGFPALPADQSLAKFGFSQLALVEKDAGSEADKADLAFVRINVPKQGVSILKLRDADVTVGEILAMVQKKRALPPNQHALERLTDPGVEIAPDVKLKDLGTNELLLIHKFSKRFDSTDELAEQTKELDVENSLKIYQYESFFVYKRGFVFGARDEMMLNVDSDKLTIIPYTMSGGALRREAKLVSYQMENIMEVKLLSDKSPSLFEIVAPRKKRKGFKALEFEAKTPEEGAHIVNKLNHILYSRPSELRLKYEMSRQEHADGSRSKTFIGQSSHFLHSLSSRNVPSL